MNVVPRQFCDKFGRYHAFTFCLRFFGSMKFRYTFSVFILLVLIGSSPVVGQQAPDSAELLRSWRAGWTRGTQAVAAVTYTETSARTIEGPRDRTQLRTVTDVRFSTSGGAVRTVRQRDINGRGVLAMRMNAIDRRMRRAYGAGFDWTRRPPPMAARLVGIGQPTGQAVAETLGDIRAWRVSLEPGQSNDMIERVIFWFAQAGSDTYPRLIRTRIVGRVPTERGRVQGGSAIIATDYVRFNGLDLPEMTQVEVIVRQIHRRRVFSVILDTEISNTNMRLRQR